MNHSLQRLFMKLFQVFGIGYAHSFVHSFTKIYSDQVPGTTQDAGRNKRDPDLKLYIVRS